MTVLARPATPAAPSPMLMARRPAPRQAPVKMPSSLSQTRISTATQCPRAYSFKYLDHVGEANTKSADSARGILAHKVLEVLFSLPSAERTIDAALALMDDAWSAIIAAEPECLDALDAEFTRADLFREATALIEVYFLVEDPTSLPSTQQEVRFEVAIGGNIPLEGVIDRIDIDADLGERITDYKVGKPPTRMSAGDRLLQVKMYALARFTITGRMPTGARLVYLGGDANIEPAQRVVEWIPTEDGLRNVVTRLGWAWEQVVALHRVPNRHPRTSAACTGCPFLTLCPEGQEAAQAYQARAVQQPVAA